MKRRTFLNRLACLGGLAAAFPAAVLQARRAQGEPAQTPRWLAQDPWKTLAAVQEHLLPATDDAPGAGDIGAIEYLYNAIGNPAADGEDRTFIVKGVGWLNELTADTFGQPFTALDDVQRETVLRKIEQSRAGGNWLSLMLTYLIEALAADPVYGGNRERAGWTWLEHQPGFPTPPEDKLWHQLGERVTFHRKAT